MEIDPDTLMDQPWSYDVLGIGCGHSWEALKVGIDRLVQLAQRGTVTQVLRELELTDPLVTAFLLIGFQRSMFFLAQATRSLGFLEKSLGIDAHIPSDEQLVGLYLDLSHRAQQLFPALEKRLESLHKDQVDSSQPHELNPWEYPPLPIGGGEVLKTQDDDAAMSLLSSLSLDLGGL